MSFTVTSGNASVRAASSAPSLDSVLASVLGNRPTFSFCYYATTMVGPQPSSSVAARANDAATRVAKGSEAAAAAPATAASGAGIGGGVIEATAGSSSSTAAATAAVASATLSTPPTHTRFPGCSLCATQLEQWFVDNAIPVADRDQYRNWSPA